MKHRCNEDPRLSYTWTSAELQAWHEAHIRGHLDWRGKRYELLSARMFGKPTHKVRFIEVDIGGL